MTSAFEHDDEGPKLVAYNASIPIETFDLIVTDECHRSIYGTWLQVSQIGLNYQELKQEVGLGHFEGRGWRGFHHHATLCIAAYGFLISERETIPPYGPRPTRRFTLPALSDGYRPRGSAAATRAPHPELHRNHAPTADRRPRQKPAPMPLLRRSNRATNTSQKFVMQ